jgi:hypothetical protein
VRPPILLVREPIAPEDLARAVDAWFGDMGANYYPGLGERALEFTALINIRPAQGNRGMEIQDPAIRERVRGIATRLIGSGGSLA